MLSNDKSMNTGRIDIKGRSNERSQPTAVQNASRTKDATRRQVIRHSRPGSNGRHNIGGVTNNANRRSVRIVVQYLGNDAPHNPRVARHQIQPRLARSAGRAGRHNDQVGIPGHGIVRRGVDAHAGVECRALAKVHGLTEELFFVDVAQGQGTDGIAVEEGVGDGQADLTASDDANLVLWSEGSWCSGA